MFYFVHTPVFLVPFNIPGSLKNMSFNTQSSKQQ